MFFIFYVAPTIVFMPSKNLLFENLSSTRNLDSKTKRLDDESIFFMSKSLVPMFRFHMIEAENLRPYLVMYTPYHISLSMRTNLA